MSDQSMAGNTDDNMTGQDPDMGGQSMGGDSGQGMSDDQGMGKPSQAEGDLGDDEMSGTESGSMGSGTSGTPTTS